MVKVEHRVGDAAPGEPAQDVPYQRIAGDGQRRLGADQRERTEAGSQTRGQDTSAGIIRR